MKFLIPILCFMQTIIAQNIDTKHIRLDLDFNWELKQASGDAAISFHLLKESNSVVLDVGNLTIQQITLNNENLQFTYRAKDSARNLSILLNRVYSPDELITIQIAYHTNHINTSNPNALGGSFGSGLRFMQPTHTTPKKRKQIWSSGEPHGNKYWFPCNEEIADIHTTEIYATAEKPLTVISNGDLISVKENNSGTRTFHYNSARPFPNYLHSIVIGEYEPIIQKTKHTIIQTFAYPDEIEAARATVELLPEMLSFLEQKTGYPFPYPSYTQVVVQDYPFPGLVGQHNSVMLSDNYIDDYGVHHDFKYLWDGVAVQALTAQWFGNTLMPKSWNDIWLNNAFAEYFAGLFTIKDNGIDEYLLWYYYPWEKFIVADDWQNEIRYPIVPKELKDVPTFNSNNNNKFRGAFVLRMLEQEVGEAIWWKAIQYYVKTYAGKLVETKDFQHAIEKVSGKSYQWFFDQWIYKIGMPSLFVTKHYDNSKKALILSIKQNQSQENKTNFDHVKFFRGKIALEIDGRIAYIALQPEAETIVSISQKTAPKYVHFNVHENFLCTYSFYKTIDEYKFQLSNAHDIAARKIALDYLTEHALDSASSPDEKSQIEALFIQELHSKKYWRYRMAVLSALHKIQAKPFNESFKHLLVELIKRENAWMKASAISILGNSKDSMYLNIYKSALSDTSDRVINAAAIAIGKTKSKDAYEILMNLENQPSWKNQNRISALNGLQQLGDERAADYALKCILDNTSPRWYLATPAWDYPFAAANTLAGLGKGDLAYPILIDRLKKSLKDKDINDIFQLVQLIEILKDAKAMEMYDMLEVAFKDDATILETVKNYKKNYLESLQ